MLQVTKDRVEEAKFFLGHLHEERAKAAMINKPPIEHFRYYLHAFLNAAYSTTEHLEGEGKRTNRKKYKDWEITWNANNVNEKTLLDELENKVRGHAVHRGDLELTLPLSLRLCRSE
jgi:hypothetical protein